MALPASDTFTAANGTALATYSANWSVILEDFVIQSNGVTTGASAGGVEAGAAWTADAFGDDHYAQGTFATVNSGCSIGVAVRVQETDNYYGLYGDSGGMYMFRVVSGTWTQFGSTASAPSNSDVIRLTIEATTLTPLKNGGSSGVPAAATTSHIASGGSAGLCAYSNIQNCILDDWSANNVSVDSSSVSPSVSPSASVSPSSSVSPSVSPSASVSPSSSPSPSVAPQDAIAWGEQTPDAGEESVTWQRWQTAADTPVEVIGDQDWGAAKVYIGTPAVSPVTDTGDASAKTFTVQRDKYDTGSGAASFYLRGDTSSFTAHAGSPSWTLYTTPAVQSWRYVQVKAEAE